MSAVTQNLCMKTLQMAQQVAESDIQEYHHEIRQQRSSQQVEHWLHEITLMLKLNIQD